MSKFKPVPIQKIRRTQADIVREFLLDEYVEFEMSESSLLTDEPPVKSTYKKIIDAFKKGNNQSEIARFCVEVNELFKEYLEYCSNHLYQTNILSKRQFVFCLRKLTLLNDMREVIMFRYSRKQIKYVFPLLKRKKT